VEDDPHQQFSNPFIHPGSIKAEKEIQAKLKEEEERVKREKESKQSSRGKTEEKSRRSKSGSSRASPDNKRPSE